MNLPTEYVTRHGRSSAMLEFPCSLFLETIKRKKNGRLSGKIALILIKNADKVTVSRYNLTQQKQNAIPKPNEVSEIEFSKLFTSLFVIIPGTKILDFIESPYLFRGKQEQSMPLSAVQEKEYVTSVDDFFSPIATKINREAWLWGAFEKLNIGNEVRLKYGSSKDVYVQQEVVCASAKSAWNLWMEWKKIFLCFSGPCTEMVFNKTFKGQIKSPKIEVDVDRNDFNPFEIAAEYLPRYQMPNASLSLEVMRRQRLKNGRKRNNPVYD